MAPPFTLDWYVTDGIVYICGNKISAYRFALDETSEADLLYYNCEIAKCLREGDYQGTRRGTVVYFTDIPIITMRVIIEEVGLIWENFTRAYYWRYVEDHKIPPDVHGRVVEED